MKLEQSETDSALGAAAFVDLDEIDEFLGAFAFIKTAAAGMAGERRDYTEVSYSTRDNVTVGFYQEVQKQQAFVRLGSTARSMFFGVRGLEEIRNAIVLATQHVNARRFAWEGQT